MNYLSIFYPLIVRTRFIYTYEIIFRKSGRKVNIYMDSVDSVLIGERIKKQRQLIGYSREKLAELVDITPRFCYDLELGLKNMSVSTLCKLSNSLHVSVDYILKGSSDPSDTYDSFISLISLCPTDKLDHLEKIIAHYIQAVRNDSE